MRKDDPSNHVAFKTQPDVAGVKLLSYFDDISDLGSDGMIYNWGFTVKGSVDEVVQKPCPFIAGNTHLRRDGALGSQTRGFSVAPREYSFWAGYQHGQKLFCLHGRLRRQRES